MKYKFLILVITSLMLSSCSPKNMINKNNLSTTDTTLVKNNNDTVCIKSIDYYVSGMKYKVFYNTKGGINVINVTKDSLDCIIQY